MKALKISFVLLYVLIGTAPLLWMGITAFKHQTDATSRIAKFIPSATDREAAGYEDSHAFAVSSDGFANLSEPRRGGAISFWQCLWSSVLISGVSTVMAVMLGTCCAYGFSRFSCTWFKRLAVLYFIDTFYAALGSRCTSVFDVH